MLTSRHFGAIEPTDYAAGQLQRAGRTVRFDLNLASPASFDAAALAEVDSALDDLDGLSSIAVAAFRTAMADAKQQPVQFWEFHRDDVAGYAELTRDGFVDALTLVRVGFYPDGAHGATGWAVLDFALRGGEPSDQLLVAKLSKDRKLLAISWES